MRRKRTPLALEDGDVGEETARKADNALQEEGEGTAVKTVVEQAEVEQRQPASVDATATAIQDQLKANKGENHRKQRLGKNSTKGKGQAQGQEGHCKRRWYQNKKGMDISRDPCSRSYASWLLYWLHLSQEFKLACQKTGEKVDKAFSWRKEEPRKVWECGEVPGGLFKVRTPKHLVTRLGKIVCNADARTFHRIRMEDVFPNQSAFGCFHTTLLHYAATRKVTFNHMPHVCFMTTNDRHKPTTAAAAAAAFKSAWGRFAECYSSLLFSSLVSLLAFSYMDVSCTSWSVHFFLFVSLQHVHLYISSIFCMDGCEPCANTMWNKTFIPDF